MNFEVVYVTDYLDELIRDGRLKLDKEYAKKVTYTILLPGSPQRHL